MKRYLLFTIGAAAVLALGLTARLQVNDSAYTAHEWGTFTSIQGSDGEPIRWNPFLTSDLPGFVFDRTRPTHNEELLRTQGQEFKTLGLKQSRDFLQRMETPVIYFRSDQALDVDVLVRFPKGLLTEWFPQVTTFGPVSGVPNLLPDTQESHLKWSRIHILPPSASTNQSVLATVPNESTPSHYYPARATAANLVETTRPFDSARAARVDGAAHVREQLLFYRGAGDFQAPLRVSLDPSSQLRLENRGHETIGPIFAVHTTNGQTAFTALGRLEPGARIRTPIPAASPGVSPAARLDELGAELRTALTGARLHADEAAAMVTTWRDSWFTENGTRILYLLPQAWTDEELPLRLHPAPRELVRVMVGRADILHQDVETRARERVADHFRGDTTRAVAGLQQLGLGRFLEPAVTRAANQIRRASTQANPGGGLTNVPPGPWPLSGQDWEHSVAELKTHLRRLESPQRSVDTASR
jgi:hypothetical protein